MRYLISAALLLAMLLAITSAETYYVTPIAGIPCPQEGVPCFTLTQYANKSKGHFVSVTTFILLPGNHSLDSEFWINNIESLTIAGTDTATNPATSVTCSQSGRFMLKNIGVVSVRGLVLIRCMSNNITSVGKFTLDGCSLHGERRNGTGLELNTVTSANIVESSFSSYTGEEMWDSFLELTFIGGGSITIWSSRVTISSSTFINNTATGNNGQGGAVYACFSVVFMNNVSFTNNVVRGYHAAGGAVFTYSSTVTMNSITFINNSMTGNNGQGGAVYFSASNVTMNSNTFSENTMTGASGYGGAMYAYSSNLIMSSNTFSINTVVGDYGKGGAVYLDATSLNSSGYLDILNSMADLGGALYALQSRMYFSGRITIMNNRGSLYAFSCNVTFIGHANITDNSYSTNSSQEGGAVTGIQSDIVFTGTANLMYNSAIIGGGISVTQSRFYVYGNITFAHNSGSLSGGGIYAYQSELNFGNHINISSNNAVDRGGGIHAVGSIIRMTDRSKTYVIGNHAKRGGGACLEMNAKLYIIKEQYYYNSTEHGKLQLITLEFTDNAAEYGGALYVKDDSNFGACHPTPFSGNSTTSSECFIQDLSFIEYAGDSNAHKIIRSTSTYHFINNSASKAGHVLYGGLLDRCTVNSYSEVYLKKDVQGREISVVFTPRSINAVSYIFDIANLSVQDLVAPTKIISSDPVRVCFCRENHPDCSYRPQPVYVKKGEMFTVSLVAVDQINNTISNSIIHGFVPLPASLRKEQSTQRTNENGSCTDLKYSIFTSHHSDVTVLSLYADGPCMDIGISTVNLTVYIVPCPIGFVDNNQYCSCDTILTAEYISDCSIDNQTVLRKGNAWFSYVNTTDFPHYKLSKHCPFDYCRPPTEIVHVNLTVPDGSDIMCAFNRTGNLCGSCKNGLSLTLGSSRCMSCSNDWLALFIVFAIAGVALVAFILICNLTVEVGTMNGLIFYANVVVFNRAVFLPFDKPNVLTVFLAWLNLDFGLETCFYNGMDGYAKIWLQLVFPLYTISLLLIITIIVYRSGKCRASKLIPTMATLILLSYTKFIRIIIAALSFTTLEIQYSDGSNKTQLVWLTDSNVAYLEGKHIPLFITGVVIAVIAMVYTMYVLLFATRICQCLMYRLRCQEVIQNFIRYMLMSYSGSYSIDHHYWVGLLLLIRVLLCLVSEVNVFGDPRINLLSINSAVVILLFIQLCHKHKITKRKLIFTIENISLLNLIGFTSVTYITEGKESQYIVAYISISIAITTFVVILFYHIFVHVIRKSFQESKSCFLYKLCITKSCILCSLCLNKPCCKACILCTCSLFRPCYKKHSTFDDHPNEELENDREPLRPFLVEDQFSQSNEQIPTIEEPHPWYNADTSSLRLQRENTRLKQEMSTLEQQNQRLQQETTAVKEDNARLQYENLTLQHQNKRLQQMTSYSSLKEENVRIKQEISTLQQQITRLEQETSAVKGENASLQQENLTFQQQNERLQQETPALKKENVCLLQQENITLQQQNERLQQETPVLKGEIARQNQQETLTFQQQNERLRRKVLDLQQQNARLQTETSTLLQQNSSLQREKKVLQSTLQQQKTRLQQEKKVIQNEKSSLQQQNIRLQQEKKEIQTEKSTLQQQNSRLQKEKAMIQNEKHREYASFQQQLSKERAKSQQLLTQFQHMELHVKMLQQQLANAKSAQLQQTHQSRVQSTRNVFQNQVETEEKQNSNNDFMEKENLGKSELCHKEYHSKEEMPPCVDGDLEEALPHTNKYSGAVESDEKVNENDGLEVRAQHLTSAQQTNELSSKIRFKLSMAEHKVVSKYYQCAINIAHVPFVGGVKILRCDYRGLRYHNSNHGITLDIAKNAIPREAGIVHLEFAVALYGPFCFPDGQQPISPIPWLCLQEDIELHKPVQITLPYFLVGLTEDEGDELEVGFIKASHNDYVVEEDQHLYNFKEYQNFSFHLSADGRHGTLETNHFCYLCMKARKIPTETYAKKCGYYLACLFKSNVCLTDKWTPASLHYCVSFFLPTCVKAIKKQYPERKGYKFLVSPKCFQFKDVQPASLQRLKITCEQKELTDEYQCEMAYNPSSGEIFASSVDFWKLSAQQMELMHKEGMYPPTLKIELNPRSVDCLATFTLQSTFSGCRNEDDLDTEFMLQLECPPRSSLSLTGSSLSNRDSDSVLYTSDDDLELALDDSTLPEPTVSHLQLIRYVNNSECKKELRLYQIIASKWRKIATSLGLEPAVIEIIANPGAGKEPDQCIMDVFQKWLENATGLPNHSRYPKNWRGLYNLLNDSECSETAQRLNKALSSQCSTILNNFYSTQESETTLQHQSNPLQHQKPGYLSLPSVHTELNGKASDEYDVCMSQDELASWLKGKGLEECDIQTLKEKNINAKALKKLKSSHLVRLGVSLGGEAVLEDLIEDIQS